ncbi:MAG: TadE/TadG family type IV pilus assembly protein [Pseudomonadota bacterium]
MTQCASTQSRARRPSRLAAFHRDENGSLIVFTLILFVLMAMMGGIAVDLMRYEATRVQLQQTLDRATLAAASLDQTLDAEDVVADYFAKAGLSDKLKSVSVDEGVNYRTVTADAKAVSENFFMQMIGIDSIDAPAASIAEQRITNVEIALVLDISGSMYNTPSRITNLKAAAKDFVDTVLAKDTENKISISIVPYNGQVNLGPDLFGKFSVGNLVNPVVKAEHYCLDLPTSTYNDTSLSRTTSFPQVPFADAYSTTTQGNGYTTLQGPTVDARNLYSNMWCQPGSANYVRVHSNNITQLKQQIDGMVAVGATSIDLGLKWGVTLLDPATRGIVSELVTSGKVQSHFSGRPGNYDDPETMKVVVLMTDGEHFAAERFNEAYRTGPTNGIWRSNADGTFSIFHASKVVSTSASTICSSKPFWVPSTSTWQSRPWNGTAPANSACYVPSATSYSGSTAQTWQNVWAVARTQWVAWQLYARPLATQAKPASTVFAEWMAAFRTTTATGTMDNRLDDLCEVSKSKGILIYGIAFEAPANGVDVIKDCANTPASTYFFDVPADGKISIKTAFKLIASNISQLRLTQ